MLRFCTNSLKFIEMVVHQNGLLLFGQRLMIAQVGSKIALKNWL